MAANETLTLWAKLLVAEYGRNRVIAALALAEETAFEDIEREVDALKRRKATGRRRRPKTVADVLEEAQLDPKVFALVKEIGSAYENKRYLPDLWRAKRFLESHGVEASKVRSRAVALPLLVRVWGQMSVGELTELVAESSEASRGDLGIIADQILGSKGGAPATRDATGATAAEQPAG